MLLRALGCRELGGIVGAVIFTFCAFTVLWLELPTFISAAVYLPLSLLLAHLAVERRSICWAMLSGGGGGSGISGRALSDCVLCGICGGVVVVVEVCGCSQVDGRGYALVVVGALLVASVALAGLIRAAQILPTLELGASSHRAAVPTSDGYARFVSNGVGAYRLVTAFVPDFFGNPSNRTYSLGSAADYMEYGLYCGVMPLALAIFGLCALRKGHVGYFVLLAGVAMLAATGTPINYFFYYFVPGFSSLGGPNRILLLYFFAVSGSGGVRDRLVCGTVDLIVSIAARTSLGGFS